MLPLMGEYIQSVNLFHNIKAARYDRNHKTDKIAKNVTWTLDNKADKICANKC